MEVKQTIGRRIILLSGLVSIGMGLYFIFFRPAFLPEDLTFMELSSAPSALIPRIELWLHKVFSVLGGFMISTGLLVIGIVSEKQRFLFLSLAWFASIGLMVAINFSIQSDFRWLLLVYAGLWLAGIIMTSRHDLKSP